MMFFRLKFVKNALLTFIVFLFGFSYLGLEQKTSAWSSIPELENRGSQVVFLYHDWICQSILQNDHECTGAFWNFIKSLENENQTIERIIFGDLNETCINTYNPFYQILLEIFYGYRDQIYQELNQQQVPIQSTTLQLIQNEDLSDQVDVSTLEQTDSGWKTHIADLKKEFTTTWLASNPDLDETSTEFKQAWAPIYQKEYNQRPEIKATRKDYDKKRWQQPEVKAAQRKYDKKRKQWPEVKAAHRACMKAYNQKPEVKAAKREYNKKRQQLPEVKAAKKSLLQTPEIKAARKEYDKKRWQQPEVKAAHRVRMNTHRQKPEVKEALREYYKRKKTQQQFSNLAAVKTHL